MWPPKCNYDIVHNNEDEPLVIQDIGPWNQYMSVTNGAEVVVKELLDRGLLPNNRKLLYYDSENQLDELLHDGPTFIGFAPGPRKSH